MTREPHALLATLSPETLAGLEETANVDMWQVATG